MASCSSCGKELTGGARFCSHCGAAQQPTGTATAHQQPVRRPRRVDRRIQPSDSDDTTGNLGGSVTFGQRIRRRKKLLLIVGLPLLIIIVWYGVVLPTTNVESELDKVIENLEGKTASLEAKQQARSGGAVADIVPSDGDGVEDQRITALYREIMPTCEFLRFKLVEEEISGQFEVELGRPSGFRRKCEMREDRGPLKSQFLQLLSMSVEEYPTEKEAQEFLEIFRKWPNVEPFTHPWNPPESVDDSVTWEQQGFGQIALHDPATYGYSEYNATARLGRVIISNNFIEVNTNDPLVERFPAIVLNTMLGKWVHNIRSTPTSVPSRPSTQQLTRAPIKEPRGFVEQLIREVESATLRQPTGQFTATLDVTKADDGYDGVCDADCSLRDAVTIAPPGALINIPAGFYTLLQGEIVIDKDLVLNGSGSDKTVIQANLVARAANHRVFRIDGGTVTIVGISVQNGRAVERTDEAPGGNSGFGGGILNYGNLILETSVVKENTADWYGGGIGNEPGARLELIGSSVTGNTAGRAGGGIHSTKALVTLSKSLVADNAAEHSGGGIWIKYPEGMLTLTNTRVSRNSVVGHGGGIYNLGAEVTVLNSIISENRAGRRSGVGVGGGVNNNDNDGTGKLNLINSAVSDNVGKYGGGISNDGFLILANTTVSGNSAKNGAGIHNAKQPYQTVGGKAEVYNSTIGGNKATVAGGGIWNERGANVRLANSILATNSSPQDANCSGEFTSLGHNLIGVVDGCVLALTDGDLLDLDPELSPLADSADTTPTHALLPGSPAIDAGDDSKSLATDQRGVARPIGAASDIGAYEYRP